MPTIPTLTTWGPTGTITAATVNTNFSTIRTYVNTYCAFLDVAGTFSAAQTFAAGISVTGTVTMATATSQLIPGATSFAVRNNANSANNLLVSDAGVVTARAGLTVTAGALTLGDAASRLVPGATSFAVRNNANDADNLLISDAGAGTFRAGIVATTATFSGLVTANASITVPTGQGITLAGTGADVLTFSGASPRIQLPSSSLGFYDGTTLRSFMIAGGTFVMGDNSALAGAATGPFLALSRMNGPASGDAAYIGAVVWDNVNDKIGVHKGSGTWVYSGAFS